VLIIAIGLQVLLLLLLRPRRRAARVQLWLRMLLVVSRWRPWARLLRWP
jgi:hypothetical protein